MAKNEPLIFCFLIIFGLLIIAVLYLYIASTASHEVIIRHLDFEINPKSTNETMPFLTALTIAASEPGLTAALTGATKKPLPNNFISYFEEEQNIPSYPIFEGPQLKFEPKNNSTLKTILFWTTLFKAPDWLLGGMGHAPFKRMKCPVSDCFLTNDRAKLGSADAVLVHFRDDFNYADCPSNRKLNQYWTFVIWESPEHTYHYIWQENRKMARELKTFKMFFNWTMTYRLDSDIPFNYGNFIPLKTPDFSRTGFDRLNNKKKSMIWMNSHCSTPSKRESYIAALSKHLDVDIIGDGCGISRPNQVTSNVCRKNGFFNGIDTRCLQYISKTYKFYLAFENSLCRDYVTEKLYRAARMDLIPVVYNGANMSLFAPNHSYIDANAFSSPEALAMYLKKVASDSKLYNSYFWWKPYYDVNLILFNDEKGFDGHPFCDLCAKVHQIDSTKNVSTTDVYEDIDKWWTVEGKCRSGYEKG